MLTGQPQTCRMGPSTSPALTADTYDPQIGNLDTLATQAGSTPVTVDDDAYHYNDAGQITAADDGGTGMTPEDQCYAYNYAGELTSKLTSARSQDTTSCAASPAGQLTAIRPPRRVPGAVSTAGYVYDARETGAGKWPPAITSRAAILPARSDRTPLVR